MKQVAAITFILAFFMLCMGNCFAFRNFVGSRALWGTSLAASSNENVIRKPEMLAKLQEKTGLTKKDSESFLAAFTELVSEEVVSNGREIRLIGFGSFKQKSSPARSVRIPKTGEMKDVPACKNLKFSASSTLKITE